MTKDQKMGMNNKVLENRVALVTGGAQGIGEAIVRELSWRGASVIACDINLGAARKVAESIQEIGREAWAVCVDVSCQESVERMVEAVLERYGSIDILVNSAGIIRSSRFEEIELDEWDEVIRVNLTGVFLCSKEVYLTMKKAGYGKIVNISSSAGRNVSDLGGAHYTASKAGVLGLTRALAREAGPEINVNAICPGMIRTGMTAAYGDGEQIESLRQTLPLQRIGEPRDVAKLVAFLVSDEASYITGEAVEIDGGQLMI